MTRSGTTRSRRLLALLWRLLRRVLLFPVGGRLLGQGQGYAAAATSYAVQFLHTCFHPAHVLRQITAIWILQLCYEGCTSLVRVLRRKSSSHSLTMRLRLERDASTTYAEYKLRAQRLAFVRRGGRLDNFSPPPPSSSSSSSSSSNAQRDSTSSPSSPWLPGHDAQHVIVKTSLYRRLMRTRDIRALMFHLRQDLLRGHQVGNTGNAYRETVIAALRLVAEAHFTDYEASTVSVAERIAFFNETRHSFGRSALLLSGGATMGMYHVGVVKALFEQELLPRVISGASAGSIVAALLGCRMDSELPGVLEFDNINTQFFSPATNAKTDKSAAGETMTMDSMIAMLPPPLPLLFSAMRRKFNKGFALDINTLETSLRENCGDYTFQEAYDRTGRIVNIVVTPTANGRMPMVLNYLTSPHVYMWSASLASCAVPGVFEPVELRARGIDGEEIPYFPQGQKWSDGSVENDLPMQRLSELFNVNHFIVSQVNPHALFLAGTSLGSGPVARMIHFLKLRVKNWISTVSVLALQFGVPILGKGLLPLLTQKYEGDCTLVPRWGVNDLFELFKDPSRERFEACRIEGERITWPKIEELVAECKVERVMDKCTRNLRAKLAAQDTLLMPGRGRKGSSGSHSLPGGVSSAAGQKQRQRQQHKKEKVNNSTGQSRNRVPSFHTSLSLLSIHDLDAGAPGPGGVRRRSSFSKSREV